MEIFFGFSNSEFINDNTFSLKDKKKSNIGTLRNASHQWKVDVKNMNDNDVRCQYQC